MSSFIACSAPWIRDTKHVVQNVAVTTTTLEWTLATDQDEWLPGRVPSQTVVAKGRRVEGRRWPEQGGDIVEQRRIGR